MTEVVSLSERREQFTERVDELQAIFQTAWQREEEGRYIYEEEMKFVYSVLPISLRLMQDAIILFVTQPFLSTQPNFAALP